MPRYNRRRRKFSKLIDPTERAKWLAKSGDPAWARGSDKSVATFGRTWASADENQRMTRMKVGFKGPGDYKAAFRGFMPGFARAAGRGIGSFFGHGDKGEGLGADFSRWMGWGRYKRRRRSRRYRGYGDYAGDAGGNQIMAGSTDVPVTVNASDDLSGDIYIAHREFLGNVEAPVPSSGLSAFHLQKYPINVGIPSSFPWLSQIAQNFTLYELQGLIYEYKPTSGELGSTSNQLGKVVMATQYDPDAPDFTSSTAMENYDYANACKPSMSMLHGVETDPKQRATQMLYIRPGDGSSNKDKVFTDIGTFQVATEGLPLSGTAGSFHPIGELWVTYRVKLSRSQLKAALGGTIKADYFFGTGGTTTVFDGSNALWTGVPAISAYYNPPTDSTEALAKKTNNIGCTCFSSTNSGFAVKFPVNILDGSYRVTWFFSVTTASSVVINNVTAYNASVNALNDYTKSIFTDSVYKAPTGSSSYLKGGSCIINVSAPGTLQAQLSVVYASSLVALFPGNITVYVEQVNPLSITGLA